MGMPKLVKSRVQAASVVCAAMLAGLCLPLGAAARAQGTVASDDAAFFKDKTVRIIVGYGPGGGYDAYARMIAPQLGKTLGANVIVENMPGAGGLVALNRTAVSPPDGLTIQLVNGTGAVLSQLIEDKAARYNLLELGNLGIVSASPWMWLVGPQSPIKSLADALKPGTSIAWAGGGPADGISDGAAFTCEALKLNCRIVIGYKGSNDAALAVIRGEMDAIYVSDTSANNYAKANGALAVLTMGRQRSRFFPQTPLVFDVAKLDDRSQWLLDFRATLEDLGRILVLPAKLPPARLAALQAAVKTALGDPALIAEGERTQRYIGFVDAEQTLRAIRKVLAEPNAEQRALVKLLMTRTQ